MERPSPSRRASPARDPRVGGGPGAAAGAATRGRLRRVARGVLALVLGCALAGLVVEVGLRASGWSPYLDPIGPRGLFVADPELGIRLSPGFRGRHVHPDYAVDVAINGDGMRDRALGPKPAGTLRILNLGDSFAYGHGVEVEKTYGRRLEALLNERAGAPPVEVWNAGAPSYGQRHMRTAFARLRERVQPDLVLVTFFFANDLDDNVAPNLTARGGLVFSQEAADYIDASPLLTFALERSDLLLWATLTWYERRYGYDPAPPIAPDEGPHEAWPSGIKNLPAAPDADFEGRWVVVEELIAALARDVRGAGCEPVLIDLPLWYQVDPEAWSAVTARHGIAPETVDLRLAADRLAALCARLGIPWFDTSAALRAPGASALFHPRDRHLNERGNAALAEHLCAFLLERGLVR